MSLRPRDTSLRTRALVTAGAVLAAGALVSPLSAASAASTPSGTSSPPSTSPPSTSSPSPSPSAGPASTSVLQTPAASAGTPIPVYAYFYQWFNASSWNRAKKDYPLAGRYSSDDPQVLSDQVKQAKAAGIDGFLTSWKSTDPLNRRLDMLIHTAKAQNFDLGVVYEALDFSRHPLPAATVQKDMVYLVDRWGTSLTSQYYGRPVIIWTGTDQYTTAEVRAVKDALGDRAYLLAASRTVAGYEQVADIVDGESYYWSSADPKSSAATVKLTTLSKAVHAHHGLWFAPAASGYDGRDLGGTRVIGREDGRTLVQSLENAYVSSPDAVAVISWNEWSENTYIEPGETYGDRELVALKNYLQELGKGIAPEAGNDSSAGDSRSSWTGAQAALSLAVITIVTFFTLLFIARHRSRGRRQAAHPHRSPKRARSATREARASADGP